MSNMEGLWEEQHVNWEPQTRTHEGQDLKERAGIPLCHPQLEPRGGCNRSCHLEVPLTDALVRKCSCAPVVDSAVEANRWDWTLLPGIAGHGSQGWHMALGPLAGLVAYTTWVEVAPSPGHHDRACAISYKLRKGDKQLSLKANQQWK